MRCGTACEVASRPLTRAASRDDAVLPVRGLVRSWARGMVDPVAVMRALPDVGWPKTGLVAVVTRFTVQDLVQTLPLALARPAAVHPCQAAGPARAPLPCAAGLLAGVRDGAVAAHRRDSARPAAADRRAIGSGPGAGCDRRGGTRVIPMPPLWVCDMALIAAAGSGSRSWLSSTLRSSCGRRRCSASACARRSAFPGGTPCRPGWPPAWSMSWEPPGSCGERSRGGPLARDAPAGAPAPAVDRRQMPRTRPARAGR